MGEGADGHILVDAPKCGVIITGKEEKNFFHKHSFDRSVNVAEV